VDTTDASGVASRVFFSTLAEGKTLFASIGGAFNETVGVTVNAAAAASVVVTGGNNQTARVTTAVGGVSFTVTDAFGNPVGSQLVTYSAAGGGSPPASGTTNAAGAVTGTGWTMGSSGAEGATGLFTNTLTATAGAASGGATGFGRFEFTEDVSPILSGCDGCHYVNFTRANIVNQADQNPSGFTSCSGWLLVDDFDANASLIYRKTAGTTVGGTAPCGGAMPGTAGLTAAQRTIIRAWINNGALNN
jgi:hypothetical protein